MAIPTRAGSPRTSRFPIRRRAVRQARPLHLPHALFQGIRLEELGIARKDGGEVESDPRKIWKLFASNWHLFRGTPTRLWFEHAANTIFGIRERLSADNADKIYDRIAEQLEQDEFRPARPVRALQDRGDLDHRRRALDPLKWHDMIRDLGWGGKVAVAYRPDSVVDPEFEGFKGNLEQLGELTGEDTASWNGYSRSPSQAPRLFHRTRATSDHGHATARTANLTQAECEKLFAKIPKGVLGRGCRPLPRPEC